jgi:hypothetical protein
MALQPLPAEWQAGERADENYSEFQIAVSGDQVRLSARLKVPRSF